MRTSIVIGLVAALICAGCAGSGVSSSATSTSPGVVGNKTLDIGNATAPSNVSSAAGTATSLTIDGEADAVPGGEVLTQGQPIFLLPDQLPVDVTSPATPSLVRPNQTTLIPGHVYFRNGTAVVDTGLMMSQNLVVGAAGTKFKRYALGYPPSGGTRTVQLVVEGPIGVGLTTKKDLDVSGELDFTFELSNGGSLGAGLQSTYPSGSLYLLPSDSESFVNAFFQVSLSALTTNEAVPATMTITWPGAVRTQTRSTRFLSPSQGSTAIMYDAGTDPESAGVVPSGGITSAELSLVK